MIADLSLEVCGVPRHLSRLLGALHRRYSGILASEAETHLPTLLGLRQGQFYVAGDSDILLSRSSRGESLYFGSHYIKTVFGEKN